MLEYEPNTFAVKSIEKKEKVVYCPYCRRNHIYYYVDDIDMSLPNYIDCVNCGQKIPMDFQHYLHTPPQQVKDGYGLGQRDVESHIKTKNGRIYPKENFFNHAISIIKKEEDNWTSEKMDKRDKSKKKKNNRLFKRKKNKKQDTNRFKE